MGFWKVPMSLSKLETLTQVSLNWVDIGSIVIYSVFPKEIEALKKA